MSENIFSTKTKADLVEIVRTSKIIPIGKAQKMRKHELADFLFESMMKASSDDNTSVNNEIADKNDKVESAKSEESGVVHDKSSQIDSSAKSSTTKSTTRKAVRRKTVSTSQIKPDEVENNSTEILSKEFEDNSEIEPTKTDKDLEEVLADKDSSSDKHKSNIISNANANEVDAVDNSTAKSESNKSKSITKSKSSNNQTLDNQDDANDKSYTVDKNSSKNDNDSYEENLLSLPEANGPFVAKPRPRRKNTKVFNRSNNKKIEKTKAEVEDKFEDKAELTEEENKKEEAKYTLEEVSGVLEIMSDGYGFLRCENYIQGPKDIYVQAQFIKRFSLRNGDFILGNVKQSSNNTNKNQDKYRALNFITEVNGRSPEEMHNRKNFERLTPIYPNEKYCLESTRNELSTRIIDLFSPIGKGQRGMVVSPPKAGKTILLQKIANAITMNNPATKLFVLLIDERPEEVTDMQRSINGEVVYSTFDKSPENHVKISELVLERAKRLVELGEDVVILVDSLTRMARAYNLTINPTGRTLSGGLDPGALHHPKRFFGAARNIENGGSLTIVATALIDTGSRMDEVIFEEFKGTGNMEVYLDRNLSEKRIFPAIDINKSSTRREDLLLSNEELEAVWAVRKAFSSLDTSNVTELIISLMMKTKDNQHMIDSLNISLKDKSIINAMKLKNDNNGDNSYNYSY